MAYLKNGVPGDRLSFASPNVHHCSQWQGETNGNLMSTTAHSGRWKRMETDNERGSYLGLVMIVA